jgi:hypothetical protein
MPEAAPTPEEIAAVIEDLIASDVAKVPDTTMPSEMFECLAFDPNGNLQGVGYGWTPEEAKAAAWICACGWLTTVPTRHLRGVSRAVPPGWTFEVAEPAEAPRS